MLAGTKRIDIFADAAADAVSMRVEPLREGIRNTVKAGSKMRFLIEITKDNVSPAAKSLPGLPRCAPP